MKLRPTWALESDEEQQTAPPVTDQGTVEPDTDGQTAVPPRILESDERHQDENPDNEPTASDKAIEDLVSDDNATAGPERKPAESSDDDNVDNDDNVDTNSDDDNADANDDDGNDVNVDVNVNVDNSNSDDNDDDKSGNEDDPEGNDDGGESDEDDESDIEDLPPEAKVDSTEADEIMEVADADVDAAETEEDELDEDEADMEVAKESLESLKTVATEALHNGGLTPAAYTMMRDKLTRINKTWKLEDPSVGLEDFSEENQMLCTKQIIGMTDVALEGMAGNAKALLKEKARVLAVFLKAMVNYGAKLKKEGERRTGAFSRVNSKATVTLEPNDTWSGFMYNGKFLPKECIAAIGKAYNFEAVITKIVEAKTLDELDFEKLMEAGVGARNSEAIVNFPSDLAENTSMTVVAMPGGVHYWVTTFGDEDGDFVASEYDVNKTIAGFDVKPLTLNGDELLDYSKAMVDAGNLIEQGLRTYRKSSPKLRELEVQVDEEIANGNAFGDSYREWELCDTVLRATFASVRQVGKALDDVTTRAMKDKALFATGE